MRRSSQNSIQAHQMLLTKANYKQRMDGTTGPSAIFANFKNAISKRISSTSPALDIMKMYKSSQHLTAATIVIPEGCAGNDPAQCNAKRVQQSHTGLPSRQQNKAGSCLIMFEMLSLWSTAALRQTNQSNRTASKLSNSQAGKVPIPNGSQSNSHLTKRNLMLGATGSSKEVKKHQAKQADEYKKMRPSPCNLPAVPLWLLLLLQPLLVTELLSHGCNLSALTNCLPKRLEPQPFVQHITMERVTQGPLQMHSTTRVSPVPPLEGPSVYEEYQQARDTLANINLPKTAHNLCPLEVALHCLCRREEKAEDS